MYVNSDLASKTFPAISKISDYLKKADSENPNERDFRPLASLLLRTISAIPRLRGHVLTRKTAVTAYDWKIEAKDGTDPAAQEAADRAKRRCAAAIRRVLAGHTDAPLFGVAGFGLTFNDKATEFGRTMTVQKRYKPFELLRIGESAIAKISDDGGIETEYEEDDPSWIDDGFLFDLDDSHERGGILRSIVFHAALSQRTVEEWNRLNNRLKGIITGKVSAEKLAKTIAQLNLNEGEVDTMVAGLSEVLKKAGEDNWLRTYDAVDISVEKIAEAAAGGSYKQFIEYLDQSISVAVLGQANTSQLPAGGGSRAALQVLQLIQADINFDDLLRCEALIDRLLLIDYAQNVGGDQDPPYRFRFKFDDVPDAEKAARTFEALSRIPQPIPVLRSEVYDRLGLSKPAEDDQDVIQFGSDNPGPL